MGLPEELLSPLLSICGLTEKYKTTSLDNVPSNTLPDTYNLFNLIKAAQTDVPEILHNIIQDFQDSLNLEIGVLKRNQYQERDFRALFNTYKRMLFQYCQKHKYLSKDDKSIFTYSHNDSDKFLYDGIYFSSFLTSPGERTSPQRERISFSTINPQNIHAAAKLPKTHTRKRHLLPQSTRHLLEEIFKIKPFPNASERKLIADRCNLTDTQVRVWFTNKRARCAYKGKK